MKVAYVFVSNMACTFKLATMILPQLERGIHGAQVVGLMFFDDNLYTLAKGNEVGERLSRVAAARPSSAPATAVHAARKIPRGRQRGQDRRDGDEDRSQRQVGNQDEPRGERAQHAAERGGHADRPGREPDATVGRRGAEQFDGHRADRRQQAGRQGQQQQAGHHRAGQDVHRPDRPRRGRVQRGDQRRGDGGRREQVGERRRLGPAVGQAAAEVVAQAQRHEHHADQAGPQVQRVAEPGGQQPRAAEFENHHRRAGGKGGHHGQRAARRRRLRVATARSIVRSSMEADTGLMCRSRTTCAMLCCGSSAATKLHRRQRFGTVLGRLVTLPALCFCRGIAPALLA